MLSSLFCYKSKVAKLYQLKKKYKSVLATKIFTTKITDPNVLSCVLHVEYSPSPPIGILFLYLALKLRGKSNHNLTEPNLELESEATTTILRKIKNKDKGYE